MARPVIWNGTPDEALALLQALSTHCACEIQDGRTVVPCCSHSMLARDQRAVDGLLFMRRMAERLLREEFEIQAARGSVASATSGRNAILAAERQHMKPDPS